MRRRRRGGTSRWAGGLVLATVLLAPTRLGAQWFDAQLPRRGELQVGISGQNITADERFLIDGSRQPLNEMFALELDPRLVPALDTLDAALAALFPTLGLPAPELSTLGPLEYEVLFERTRVPISIAFAPTRWLAVFTVVPIVKARSFVAAELDSLAASAGSTASAFGGNADAFFAGLAGGINALESMVAADTLAPDDRAEAEALLAEARLLESGLLGLGGLTYTPTDSSANGAALAGLYTDLRGGFAGFEVELPELSLARALDAEAATALTSGPAYGIEPPASRSTGIKLGDIEAGISVQPFNTFRRPPGAARPSFPIRARLDALLRFATGSPPVAGHVMDPGAGDGQPDLEVRGAFDLGLGARFWLSLFAGYNLQLEAEVERLITSRESPIQPGAYTALVSWDPGDVLTLAALPRFNLTRHITFSFLYLITHHGADRVEPVDSAPEGPAFEPSDLEEGTEFSARTLGFAARYSATEWAGDRRRGIPVEVELRYRNTNRAVDGFTPRQNIWEVSVRLYRQLFWRTPTE